MLGRSFLAGKCATQHKMDTLLLSHFRRHTFPIRWYEAFLHHKMHWPLQVPWASANYRHTKPRCWPESSAQVDMGQCAGHVSSAQAAGPRKSCLVTLASLLVHWNQLVPGAAILHQSPILLANLYVARSSRKSASCIALHIGCASCSNGQLLLLVMEICNNHICGCWCAPC